MDSQLDHYVTLNLAAEHPTPAIRSGLTRKMIMTFFTFSKFYKFRIFNIESIFVNVQIRIYITFLFLRSIKKVLSRGGIIIPGYLYGMVALDVIIK